jgi:hypothetical protein
MKQKLWLHIQRYGPITPTAIELSEQWALMENREAASRFSTQEETEIYLRNNLPGLDSQFPGHKWHVEENLPFFVISAEHEAELV